MENREVINKEALLNRALASELSDDMCHEYLMEVAQDCLRDKLRYLGYAKIYKEAGDNETAEEYKLSAERVDEWYLNPLSEILGEIKLHTWDMEERDIEEIRKYFGDEYFENEDD